MNNKIFKQRRWLMLQNSHSKSLFVLGPLTEIESILVLICLSIFLLDNYFHKLDNFYLQGTIHDTKNRLITLEISHLNEKQELQDKFYGFNILNQAYRKTLQILQRFLSYETTLVREIEPIKKDREIKSEVIMGQYEIDCFLPFEAVILEKIFIYFCVQFEGLNLIKDYWVSIYPNSKGLKTIRFGLIAYNPRSVFNEILKQMENAARLLLNGQFLLFTFPDKSCQRFFWGPSFDDSQNSLQGLYLLRRFLRVHLVRKKTKQQSPDSKLMIMEMRRLEKRVDLLNLFLINEKNTIARANINWFRIITNELPVELDCEPMNSDFKSFFGEIFYMLEYILFILGNIK